MALSIAVDVEFVQVQLGVGWCALSSSNWTICIAYQLTELVDEPLVYPRQGVSSSFGLAATTARNWARDKVKLMRFILLIMSS